MTVYNTSNEELSFLTVGIKLFNSAALPNLTLPYHAISHTEVWLNWALRVSGLETPWEFCVLMARVQIWVLVRCSE